MQRISYAVSAAIIVAFLVAGAATAQQPAPAGVRSKPTVKLLKCQAVVSGHNCFMSPHGEWAVIFEGNPGNSQRLSLWDLKQGKLVRFLSAEKDKGTKEYIGADDADFGATIGQSGSAAFTFSTDGKLAAACVGKTVKIWELASGKLLQEVEGSSFHPHTFRFVDERQIVGKSNGGVLIEVIDGPTGEKRKLMGPVNYESYGGAVRGDTFALVSPFEVFTLSIKTGERKRLAALSDTSRMAPSRTWYSPDGAKLYIQREEMIQELDVASGKYTSIVKIAAPNEGHRLAAVATDANVLFVQRPQFVELWNASLGAPQATIIPPSKSGNMGGVSSDGSKMILAQDRAGAVVLDFGGPPPVEEDIDVTKLIAEQSPMPTR